MPDDSFNSGVSSSRPTESEMILWGGGAGSLWPSAFGDQEGRKREGDATSIRGVAATLPRQTDSMLESPISDLLQTVNLVKSSVHNLGLIFNGCAGCGVLWRSCNKGLNLNQLSGSSVLSDGRSSSEALLLMMSGFAPRRSSSVYHLKTEPRRVREASPTGDSEYLEHARGRF